MISGHFDPEFVKEFKGLLVELDLSVQEGLERAISSFVQIYKKPEKSEALACLDEMESIVKSMRAKLGSNE